MLNLNLNLAPAQWRKSTYSGDGGHCVENAVIWQDSNEVAESDDA